MLPYIYSSTVPLHLPALSPTLPLRPLPTSWLWPVFGGVEKKGMSVQGKGGKKESCPGRDDDECRRFKQNMPFSWHFFLATHCLLNHHSSSCLPARPPLVVPWPRKLQHHWASICFSLPYLSIRLGLRELGIRLVNATLGLFRGQVNRLGGLVDGLEGRNDRD